MNSLIYSGAVAAGAVTLLIEAFRNFNSQTNYHPFSLHPILKGVEVRNLCTTGEVIAGFAFYAALYLIVYAVVLGSAEVYELLVAASNARNEIGATDNVLMSATDPALLSSTSYGKPIFVSALLISFLSIGAVKPIEATMRGLAHRLAGIPRGVYKVIENLRGIPYEDFMEDQPGQLVIAFRAAASSIKGDRNFAAKCRDIETTLASIDCLSAATGADDRSLYFPLYRMTELSALSLELDMQIKALHVSIARLDLQLQPPAASGEPPPTADEIGSTLQEVLREAATTRSNTMAVFAVLFVRNNRSVFSQRGVLTRKSVKKIPLQSPIEKTTKYIQENYNAEQNSFAIGLFVAVILGAVGTFAIYEQWRDWKVAGDELVYREQTLAVSKEIKAGRPACDPPAEDCEKAEAIRRYALAQRPVHIKTAAWDTAQSALLVFLSVFLVLVGREVRMEQQSWQTGWKFYQFPFLRLLGMSLLSGFVAVFTTAAVSLAKLVWDTSFKPTQTQITFLFEQSGQYFILQFGAGIIVSFAALVIMDKHRHVSVLWTTSIAIISALLYGLYMLVVNFLTYEGALPPAPKGVLMSQAARDALISTLVPFLFLTLFAVMLEITELGDNK